MSRVKSFTARVAENPETKPGIYTTEFWVTAVTALLDFAKVLPVPASWHGVVGSAVVAVYAISRGVAKHGQAYYPPLAPAAFGEMLAEGFDPAAPPPPPLEPGSQQPSA